MKRTIFGLLVVMAVFEPAQAGSVTWSGDGVVIRVRDAPPAGVVIGAPVKVTVTYDPDVATLAPPDSGCGDEVLYEFPAGAALIRVEIAGLGWTNETRFAGIVDDGDCAGCLDRGDTFGFWTEDPDEPLNPGAWLMLADCEAPYEAVFDTALPTSGQDLNYRAAQWFRGAVGDGWRADFEITDFRVVAVAASTWTRVKTVYR